MKIMELKDYENLIVEKSKELLQIENEIYKTKNQNKIDELTKKWNKLINERAELIDNYAFVIIDTIEKQNKLYDFIQLMFENDDNGEFSSLVRYTYDEEYKNSYLYTDTNI